MKSLFILIMSAALLSCDGREQDPDRPVETEEAIHVAHILIMFQGAERAPAGIGRSRDEALQQVQNLLDKIQRGADFSQLATLYSDCPSKRRGGDLKEIRRGDLHPDFEKAAFALDEGQVSGIVETDLGFHIIKRLP